MEDISKEDHQYIILQSYESFMIEIQEIFDNDDENVMKALSALKQSHDFLKKAVYDDEK